MAADVSSKAPAGTAALEAKALEVHRRLCASYGAPFAFFHHHDPLSELVAALLSHRTRNADSKRAFEQLTARFANFEAVRDADPTAVVAAISPCTWPEQKAPRLQNALVAITERRGGLSLDFLADMAPAAAEAWLQGLPGIGPKTSAAVLLFSRLRMPALPVDSHHHRVAQRVGLIPAKLAVGPAHPVLKALLPHHWDAQALYDHHEALMYHGQRCCHYRKPACERCPVGDLCDDLARRQGESASAAASLVQASD
ncbi:MAG: endonuclease III domain-containing protein [Candidatus Competibacterales bacterium]